MSPRQQTYAMVFAAIMSGYTSRGSDFFSDREVPSVREKLQNYAHETATFAANNMPKEPTIRGEFEGGMS